ncbi:hypothetical protein [Ralstonia phage RP13]|nr:hypothetical protein [Ralstonia phage RP13]
MAITQNYLRVVCRKYCELNGENPDEIIALPRSSDEPITFGGRRPQVERWTIYQQLAKEHILMAQAVKLTPIHSDKL